MDCQQLMNRATSLWVRGDLQKPEYTLVCYIVGRYIGGLPAKPSDLDGLLEVGLRQRQRYLQTLKELKLVHAVRHRNHTKLVPYNGLPAPTYSHPLVAKEPQRATQPPPETKKPDKPERERYKPVSLPDEWALALSPKQQSAPRMCKVSQHKALTRMLQNHHPRDINSKTWKSVREATYPMGYLARLCTPDGKLQKHVRSQDADPAHPAPQPQAKPTPPTMPPRESRPSEPNREAKPCNFSAVYKMLDEMPEPKSHRTRSTRSSSS